MSGTAVRYGRVVGLVAAGALAFSMAPAGGAQADPTPTPSATVTPTDSPTPSPSDTSTPAPTASETVSPTAEPTTASPAPTTTTPAPTKSPTPPPGLPPSSCVITGYSPRSVTIAWKDVVEKFNVTWKSAPGKKCVAPSWWIGDGTADGDLADSSANYKYGTQFYHTTFRNKDAGWYDILVGLQSGNKPKEKLAVAHSTFSFLRATAWKSFDASPEPVKKGKKISLKGVVQRIDWDASAKSKKATYINLYAGATVDVQFRPKGSSTYTTLKVVKTATGGKVNTTITAAKSGTWRLHFVTTATTGYSTSKTDYVQVK